MSVTNEDKTVRRTALITRVEHYEKDDGVYINLYNFNWWASNNATIDGVPIGVPEVDKCAMRNGAEGEELFPCDTCKHSRWFGEYGMQVCEKRGKDRPFPDCYDCATEGGEE